MPEPMPMRETAGNLPRMPFAEPGIITEMPFYSGIGQIMPDTPPSSGMDLVAERRLEEITRRFGIAVADVKVYLNPGEQLTGFGNGGSESLVLFVRSPERGDVVRKVCSEQLSSVQWDPHGTGVMSPPSVKAKRQVEYLQALPDSVRPYFPSVFDVHEMEVPRNGAGGGVVRKLVYDQSLLIGQEVSTFIAEHRPTPGVVAHLHREILRCLADRVHPYRRIENTGSTIEESYLDKITARLELSQRAAPRTFGPLLTSNSIVINGQSYRNIGELLAFFRKPEIVELLEPKYHSLVMGDTNTENVMITKPEALLEAMQASSARFTYDDLGIRFLDPRAIGHNSAGADTVDDRMYDNKPVHNSLGNYDMIHGEHFQLGLTVENGVPHIDIKADSTNPFRRSYEGMRKYFGYVMDGWNVKDEDFLHDDPNWLLRFTFMMGSHFAAMPPFHFKRGPGGNVPEDPEVQKRAIAIYCEGIKWLNRAHDMITGNCKGLYGVPVSGIKPTPREYDGVERRRVPR